ncbi:MAG: InlB B-repeat-containing protein, partial [Candidatus Tenebribacter mawsonii]|nr:InlB B-repeat-containing protein [Candidatus Tenebribacter mawsonii]
MKNFKIFKKNSVFLIIAIIMVALLLGTLTHSPLIGDTNDKVAYASTNLSSSSSGMMLTTGTYYVTTDVTFTNGSTGGNGLTIANSSIVTIYINAGVTLTCVGQSGSGTIGGGTGISIPSNSTLYLRGNGSVVAIGGDGTNAGNGAAGLSSSVGAYGNDYSGAGVFHSGKGGDGGTGGGAPGAGIGGTGGTGGTGGAGGASVNTEYLVAKNGIAGSNGSSGSSGMSMGTLYICDSVSVTATAGNTGSSGNSAQSGISNGWFHDGYSCWFGGGAGASGGGGGAGSSSANIGGSGGGGGGGGGGSSGAWDNAGTLDCYFIRGNNGGGGGGSGIAGINHPPYAYKGWNGNVPLPVGLSNIDGHPYNPLGWGGHVLGGNLGVNGATINGGIGGVADTSRSITYAGGSGGNRGSGGSGGTVYVSENTGASCTTPSGGSVANGEGEAANYVAVENHTTYTFQFNSNVPSEATNAITGTMPDCTYNYDISENLPENQYSLFAWRFTGWNTAADGTGTAYSDQATIYQHTEDGSVIELFAQWTPDLEYTITYDINKPDLASNSVIGTTVDSTHYYDILNPLSVNGYSLTGWTMTGWNTSKDGTGTAYDLDENVVNLTNMTETLTLHAQWTENYYTVKYNSNIPSNATNTISETILDSTHQYENVDNLNINEFTLFGWNFVGWNRSSDGSGVSFLDEGEITQLSATDAGTVFLYAQWEPYKYSVKFDINKPSASTNEFTGTIEDMDCVYDTEFTLSSNDYGIIGWTFVKWNTSADGSGYDYDNQSTIFNLTDVDLGEVIIYAQWVENNYTIVYDKNKPNISSSEVEGVIANSSYTYEEIKSLEINNYSLLGWTYNGWNTEADGSKHYTDEEVVCKINPVDEAITVFYAQWTQNNYDVTYKFNKPANAFAEVIGVTTDSSHIYDTASPITDNSFVLTGWSFYCWNTNADGSGDNYADEQDISELNPINDATTILYAQWTAHTYSVQFEPNKPDDSTEDLEGTMSDLSCTYDTASSLTSNLYNIGGWTMTGWNTHAVGTGTPYDNGETITNLNAIDSSVVILYAQWSQNSYEIVFDSNIPSNASSNIVGETEGFDCDFETEYSLTTNDYSLLGWTFIGWNSSEYGDGTAYTNEQNISKLNPENLSTVTMYAQWDAHTYTVSYNSNIPATASEEIEGDTTDSSHIYDTESAITTNEFTLIGWTFVGWTTVLDGSGDAYSDTQLVSILNSSNGGLTEFFAQWTENTYEIVFNANKPISSSENIVGNTEKLECDFESTYLLTTNDYSLLGWTFIGWNSEFDGSGDSYVDNQSVLKINLTDGGITNIYAQWTENCYHIIYDNNRPESAKAEIVNSMENTDCQYESTYNLNPNAFTLIGWTFVGWNTMTDGNGESYIDSQSFSKMTATDGGSNILFAQWTVNTYTITYEMDGGENNVSNPLSYIYDDDDITLQDPSKIGYTFLGWSEGSLIATANIVDITRTATWSANNYTVKYLSNKPSYSYAQIVGTTEISAHTYDIASALSINGFTLTGWKFAGWNTVADGSGDSYTDYQDVSTVNPVDDGETLFYAQWEENIYYVSYFINQPNEAQSSVTGETNTSTYSYDILGSLSLSGYSLYGWHQIGWNTVDDGSGDSYEDGANIIRMTAEDEQTINLYAQWAINQYSIFYDENKPQNASNDVLGETLTSIHTYDYNQLISVNGYSLIGWTFDGWNIENDGSGTSYTDQEEVLNITGEYDVTITFYAQWIANTYSVIYDSNKPADVTDDINGVMLNSEYTYDTLSTLAVNELELSNYKVIGWNTSSDGSGESYSLEQEISTISAVNGDTVTLYAQWQNYDYTIIFESNLPLDATNVITGVMDEMLCLNDIDYNLIANGFNLTGWSFTGWNTVQDGTGDNYYDEELINLSEIFGEIVL